MTTRIPATAKSVIFFLSATGAAAIAVHASNPNFHSNPRDSITERLGAGISATVRSSRAVFTIASNVVDYKYSLFGMDADSDEYRAHLSQVHLRAAKRILKLCDSNKGFYVKAGQFIAAMRQVPKEYSATLSSLQDQAVPCNFKAIKAVLIRNLGKDLSDVFMSFDEHPLAAASIAQVHRAVLKDHQEVAVKVQYPGLEQQMILDTSTMYFLSTFVARIFPEYRFQWAVSEFVKTISLELDFIQEARNSEKTAKNFVTNKIIKVPRVFWEFTSSQVLVMELCRGNKVDDLEFIKRNQISPARDIHAAAGQGHKTVIEKMVGQALVDLFAEMIFIHGFVHGDPHPGNILISPEGEHGFSLVLLDHGIYRQLNEDFRKEYCKLWKSMILLDAKSIYSIGEKFGIGRYARFLPLIFTGRTIDSKSALGRGMTLEEKEKMKLELKQLKMEDISSFLESLPPDFLAILRTDGLLRSLLSKLGASHRVRLVSYAKHALYGLALELDNEHGLEVQKMRPSIRTSLSYLRLRLLIEIIELLSWMDNVRHLIVVKMQQVISSASRHLWLRHLLPLSVS